MNNIAYDKKDEADEANSKIIYLKRNLAYPPTAEDDSTAATTNDENDDTAKASENAEENEDVRTNHRYDTS